MQIAAYIYSFLFRLYSIAQSTKKFKNFSTGAERGYDNRKGSGAVLMHDAECEISVGESPK